MSHEPPERIDPLDDVPGIVAHHETKYRFARTHSRGDVLDVGCGVGYGSDLLAEDGRTVVGLDIADEALHVARRYVRPGLSFARMSATALGVAPASFDTVICFEAIEHFDDPDAHLAEVARVLKPGGVYLSSTPQPGTGGAPDVNHHHLHEFDREQYTTLLGRHFHDVEVLGQRRLRPRSYAVLDRIDRFRLRGLPLIRPIIRRVGRRVGLTATEDASLNDFRIDSEGAIAGHDFVAVCRNARAHAEASP